MLYKLIVLHDGTEHKCPDDHNWLAMDITGDWFTYETTPVSGWRAWYNPIGDTNLVSTMCGPFEPGDWTTQLYWIGD